MNIANRREKEKSTDASVVRLSGTWRYVEDKYELVQLIGIGSYGEVV